MNKTSRSCTLYCGHALSAVISPIIGNLTRNKYCFCFRQEFELTTSSPSDIAIDGSSLEEALKEVGKGL